MSPFGNQLVHLLNKKNINNLLLDFLYVLFDKIIEKSLY